MTIRYEVRDLLSVPQGYYLAHNISADLSLKGKVARKIDEAFNLKPFLEHEVYDDDCVGCCIFTGSVFNLVTKKNRHCSVDLEDFKEAVKTMATICDEFGIRKLAMPKLGTGGDRLDWDDVLPIIKEAFKDLDIEILVCVLSEDDIPDEDDDDFDSEKEYAYARSIDALIIATDDIESLTPDYNEIRLDKRVFSSPNDCFEPEAYIDIYIADNPYWETSCYEMIKEDDDWIYLSFMGYSRD